MRIKFTKQSLQDVDNIYNYVLQKSNKKVALKIIHQIKNAIDDLKFYVSLGRRHNKNTRRLVIPQIPFIVVYKIDKNKKIVYIITVFHTARKL